MEKAVFVKIREEIMCELLNTKESVKIAMAYFTDNKIIDLLCTLASKGISVSVIISGEEINFHQSGLEFQKIINSGANLLIYTTANDANSILHHKFCIIDNKILLSGSYNWTKNALSNRENIIIIDNQLLVKNFIAKWESLELNSVRINDSQFFVVPSGFDEYDNEYEGFLSGSLTVVYGESGSGKTSFIITLIKQCAVDQDIPICFLSSSLPINELRDKLIRNLTELELNKNEEYEFLAKKEAIKRMESKKIHIHQNIRNYQDIKFSLLKVKNKDNIKLGLIDELDFELSNQELKELRMLAKQLNIAIILTKKPAKNSNKKTNFSSLSEIEKSIIIENLGHHYIYLLRPEIYNILEDQNGNSLAKKIIFIHANGKFVKSFRPEISKIHSTIASKTYSQEILFQAGSVTTPSFFKDEEDIPF